MAQDTAERRASDGHGGQSRRPARAARAVLLALGALAPLAAAAAEPALLPTPGEASNYARYTQADDVARFLSELDHRSARLAVQVVGRSGAVGSHPEQDLYLAILSAEGAAEPAALQRSRPTLLLFASQHGDEQSGKEAALWLVRELALGALAPLLEQLNVLVVPQLNPHGNAVDRRVNEQDLDLNRDHVKLEAPQTRALHRVFRRWMPELTVDVHEKGDDYYRASFGCVSNPNIAARLLELCRGGLLADVAAELQTRGVSFHEYLVTQPLGIESAAGAALPQSATENRPRMTRFSTTDLNDGRNGLGIYQTLSLIFEGASRRDVATLAERTDWQIAALRALLHSAARRGGEIAALVRSLRAEQLQRAASYSEDERVALRMEYARSAAQPVLRLLRFAPAAGLQPGPGAPAAVGASAAPSEAAPTSSPAAIEEVVENWFPDVRSTLSVARPLGYLIPAQRREVVELLLAHDIAVELLTAPARVPVQSYRIARATPAAFDYLAPELDVELESAEQSWPAGSFYVRSAQPAAQLIAALLEPQSQYGLIRYQKLGLLPTAGERFAFARVVQPPQLESVPYKPWPR
jgi:hypothetical protein